MHCNGTIQPGTQCRFYPCRLCDLRPGRDHSQPQFSQGQHRLNKTPPMRSPGLTGLDITRGLCRENLRARHPNILLSAGT